MINEDYDDDDSYKKSEKILDTITRENIFKKIKTRRPGNGGPETCLNVNHFG
jgi:hypothetical protein